MKSLKTLLLSLFLIIPNIVNLKAVVLIETGPSSIISIYTAEDTAENLCYILKKHPHPYLAKKIVSLIKKIIEKKSLKDVAIYSILGQMDTDYSKKIQTENLTNRAIYGLGLKYYSKSYLKKLVLTPNIDITDPYCLSLAYLELGNIYFNRNLHSKASDYYNLSLKIASKLTPAN